MEKVKSVVMGVGRLLLTAGIMLALLLFAAYMMPAHAQEPISKHLKLSPGAMVPVVEWGNLGDSDNWEFKLNKGEAGVGFEIGWWDEDDLTEEDRDPLDWDIGFYTFLSAENGEDFSAGIGVLFSTMKYIGADLLQLGIKVRLSGSGSFTDRLSILWGIGIL